MASFFGEVIQGSSRTVDDGDDFDETVDSLLGTPQFESTLTGELRGSAKLLVIADGHQASSFCKSCLLNAENAEAVGMIGKVELKEDDDSLLGLRPRKSIPSKIHLLAKDVLLCLTSSDVSAHESYIFATEALKLLHLSGTVAVLTSAPLAYYKTDGYSVEPNTSVLRVLSTSAMSAQAFERLEQPNIVSGVPAAVLSRCEVRCVPAALSVVFTEFNDFDNAIGALYATFLEHLDVSKILNLPSLPSKGLRSLCSTNTGNLYM